MATKQTLSLVARIAIFTYGVVCYAIFFATYCYLFGFMGNVVVPRSIDSEPLMSLNNAVLVDSALLGLFGVQHEIMARPAFKVWWTQFVPSAMERSTFVLSASLILINMVYFWQPVGGTIWEVTSPTGIMMMQAMFVFGWLLVLVSTFLIDHFDLFGLRQVWLCLLGKEYTPHHFVTPGPYKVVRHPLYVGWLFAFWSTPKMTASHLLFALITTVHILIGIQFEERDLVYYHGKSYEEYRREVPMLIPFTGGAKAKQT